MHTQDSIRKMENENESRPLLYPFQSETWRSRARKRCVRIPSEITITGIILGLFLIVVTLLIVLENMESDKKQNSNASLSLLASPMKSNKKAEMSNGQNVKDYTIFQNKQSQKWDQINKERKQLPDSLASSMNFNKMVDDPFLQAKRDNIMKIRERKMEFKNRKLDNVINGWKQLPNISASSMNFNNIVEDPFLQAKKDYIMKIRERKMELKNRKLDNVINGWKQLPNIAASSMNFNKMVDDPFLQAKRDYIMKIRERKMEFKNRKLDNVMKGWKQIPFIAASPMKYSVQPEDELWEDNIKLKERKWDKVNKGWKNLPDISGNIHDHDYEEEDEVETVGIVDSLDEYGKEIDSSLERFAKLRMGEASAMRQFRDEALEAKNLLHSGINWKLIDDGWKTLSEQGWSEKDLRRALFMAMKEKREEIRIAELQDRLQFSLNTDNTISDAWKRNLYEGIGTDDAKRHLDLNDEWRKKDVYQPPITDMKKFVKGDEGWDHIGAQGQNKELKNLLQSSYEKWKENEEKTDKHSKHVSKDKNTGPTDAELVDFQMNFDDFSNIIEAYKEYQKGLNNPKSQLEINDEFANTFGNRLQSTYKKMKKYEELREKHFKDDMNKEKENGELQQSPMNLEDIFEIIEAIKKDQKERKRVFGRNDVDATSSPDDASLQKSEQDYIGKEWQKLGVKAKEMKEAVSKAWQDGDQLRKSAIGQNDMKWKKVKNGWKTISNKS